MANTKGASMIMAAMSRGADAIVPASQSPHVSKNLTRSVMDYTNEFSLPGPHPRNATGAQHRVSDPSWSRASSGVSIGDSHSLIPPAPPRRVNQPQAGMRTLDPATGRARAPGHPPHG